MNQLAQQRLNILFLVRDLHHGGAQYQLCVLARGLHQCGHQVAVAVFYGGGNLEGELRDAGVTLYFLDKRGRWDLAGFLWRLHRCVTDSGAQCLHSYMPVANLLSVLVGAWKPQLAVIWGIRSSAIPASYLHPMAKLCHWLEQHLARFADLCISNSETGRRDAMKRGFPGTRLRVVANGIDMHYFNADAQSRRRQRQHWDIPLDAPLIGLVGRLDLLKNHPAFLHMAAHLLARHPTLRFVCVGDGPASYQQQLIAQANALGLERALLWAGNCEDMPAAYNALDILVSSSVSEGFANVIAEAMACEIPCVVTAVGDARIIVADSGIVVPSADPLALAAACDRLLSLPSQQRQALGQRCRQRIAKQFSLNRLITNTEQLLDCLVTRRPLPSLPTPSSTTDS